MAVSITAVRIYKSSDVYPGVEIPCKGCILCFIAEELDMVCTSAIHILETQSYWQDAFESALTTKVSVQNKARSAALPPMV